jgi:hypothetical protein
MMSPALVLNPGRRILRKAVSWATIIGTVTQTKQGACTIITTEQTATGGLKGETERAWVDGAEHEHVSQMFGVQRVCTRWLNVTSRATGSGVATGDKLDIYLRQGWLEEEAEGVPEHIWITSTCDKGGWRAEQVWGFALVDGKRHHVKRFVVTKGEERAAIRIVYDWLDTQ